MWRLGRTGPRVYCLLTKWTRITKRYLHKSGDLSTRLPRSYGSTHQHNHLSPSTSLETWGHHLTHLPLSSYISQLENRFDNLHKISSHPVLTLTTPTYDGLVLDCWYLDIKSASNHISQMAVPTVLVELKVQQPPSNTNQDDASLVSPPASFTFLFHSCSPIQTRSQTPLTPPSHRHDSSLSLSISIHTHPTTHFTHQSIKVKTILFELDSVTLQTMLDGLGKIRDQLAAI